MEQQERYYLEQRLIPEILYSEECSRFIMVLLQDRGKFFVNVLNTIGKESGYQCPYKPEQFVFKPQILSGEDKSQDIAFLFIDMPEPERVPLCSRIIICHDAAISNPRYYTVEKLLDLRPNYGGGNEDNRDLLQKVLGMCCHTQCPRPHSRPPLTHASARHGRADTWRRAPRGIGAAPGP